MSLQRFQRLVPIVDAQYEAEFVAIRGILEEEARCRAELTRLDEMAAQVVETAVKPGPMHLIGAEVLFQQSLARNRARLIADLARVLARKVEAMDRVRLAFGRKNAVEKTWKTLSEHAAKSRTSRLDKAALTPWLSVSKDRNDH